jgi:hypothetical protein
MRWTVEQLSPPVRRVSETESGDGALVDGKEGSKNGFILRDLGDKRNPIYSLTSAEMDEWRPAMWRRLGLGIASSRGVLWCVFGQGNKRCSTRGLGRSSLI